MSRKYLNDRWCVRCPKTTPTPYLKENLKHFPPHGRVLDIGCGNGRNTKFMASKGYNVIAVDMAPPDFGVAMVLGEDDLTAHGVFDIVIANYVLMFLNKGERNLVMDQIDQVTKVGGILTVELYAAKDAYECSIEEVSSFFFQRGWQKIRLSKEKCVLVKER